MFDVETILYQPITLLKETGMFQNKDINDIVKIISRFTSGQETPLINHVVLVCKILNL